MSGEEILLARNVLEVSHMFFLLKDNDPKHTCKKAQEGFKNHGSRLLQ